MIISRHPALPQRREAFRSVRLQAITWKILNYGESMPLVYRVTFVVNDYAHCTMTGAFGARLARNDREFSRGPSQQLISAEQLIHRSRAESLQIERHEFKP